MNTDQKSEAANQDGSPPSISRDLLGDGQKANCYECKYRGEIPGDAHSMCRHPLVKQDSNVFGALVDMLSGKNIEAQVKLKIRANAVGVRQGWFYWPANYDPVWLENCDGFTKRESPNDRSETPPAGDSRKPEPE